MKISTIQSGHVLYDVRNPREYSVERLFEWRDNILEQVFTLTEQAAQEGADLIVTTEAVNASVFGGDPRYPFNNTGEPLDGPLIKKFADIAGKYQTYIVAGLHTIREGKVYNSALLFNPQGNLQGIYDKTHPTDFELQDIMPGNEYPIFETEFGNLAMLICFDLQYPEAVREVALAGADLIACPTWGWENIYGLCRAYESSVYIAAANSLPPHGEMWEWCDPSCIVDNMGKIIAVGARSSIGIVTAEVDIRKEPDIQYDKRAEKQSMRQVRAMLRRPETYKMIVNTNPPLLNRYQ